MAKPPIVVRPQPVRPGQPTRGPIALPPKPQPINRGGLMPVTRGTVIAPPTRFGNGQRIVARPVVGGPTNQNVTIINNTTVINNINVYNRTEVYPGRYYWHDWDGNRYCHYYDTWGYHWYGWYIGDSYFWTRYWNDMYWYYDPYWGRWVYLRDGRWWWQDPVRVNVVYVYVPETTTYYQYDNNPGGGVVMTPDPTPAVTPPPQQEPSQPAAPQPQKIFYSADGRRSVQIFGDTNDAFLYDTAETPAFNPVYLASNVTEARFSQTAADQPLQVLLLTETTADDGTTSKSFLVYDENGNSLMGAPQNAPADALPSSTDEPAQTPAPSATLQLLNQGFSF